MRQDVTTLMRVCREQDDLHRTAERLCSKHGVARNERDRFNQERNAARQQVISLEANLGEKRSWKLEAEATATGLSDDLSWETARLQTLEKELAVARVSPEEAVAERAGLLDAIGQVCDDLVVSSGGSVGSTLGSRAPDHGLGA